MKRTTAMNEAYIVEAARADGARSQQEADHSHE